MGVVQLVERRIWDAEDFPGSSPGTHTQHCQLMGISYNGNYVRSAILSCQFDSGYLHKIVIVYLV